MASAIFNPLHQKRERPVQPPQRRLGWAQRGCAAEPIGGGRDEAVLAETVLAMEMGADLEDLALTIHAHPTLSETPMFAAEMGLGSITDLYIPKK
jgi:hypothetical protein